MSQRAPCIVLLTSEEREIINQAAAFTGKSVSSWIRDVCMWAATGAEPRIPVRPGRQSAVQNLTAAVAKAEDTAARIAAKSRDCTISLNSWRNPVRPCPPGACEDPQHCDRDHD